MSNRINVIGNIGSDPLIKGLGDEKNILFTVYDNKTTNDKSKPIPFRCKMFAVSPKQLPYIKSGTKISIWGRYELNIYESAGEEKENFAINVQEMEFL